MRFARNLINFGGQHAPKDLGAPQESAENRKTGGFNIENTHLTDIIRIKNLFALMLIAFVLAYKAGIFLNTPPQSR